MLGGIRRIEGGGGDASPERRVVPFSLEFKSAINRLFPEAAGTKIEAVMANSGGGHYTPTTEEQVRNSAEWSDAAQRLIRSDLLSPGLVHPILKEFANGAMVGEVSEADFLRVFNAGRDKAHPKI